LHPRINLDRAPAAGLIAQQRQHRLNRTPVGKALAHPMHRTPCHTQRLAHHSIRFIPIRHQQNPRPINLSGTLASARHKPL
jgi:hypothetical protein